MMSFYSIAPTLVAVQTAAWLFGGGLIGAAYFWTLRWNVRRLCFRRRALVLATGLQAVRFLLLAGSLAALAAHCGAPPLLFAAAGIVGVRTVMTARLGMPT